MCDPVTIGLGVAGLAATAAGGGIQAHADNKAQKIETGVAGQRAIEGQRLNAQKLALARAETERQTRLQGEAARLYDQTAPQYGRPAMDQRLADAERQRTETIAQPTGFNPAQDFLPGQPSGSMLTRTIIADRTAEARAKLAKEALARAKLGAWGDAFRGLADATQPASDRIGQVGSFREGSKSVVPLEDQASELASTQRDIALQRPLTALPSLKAKSGMGSIVSGVGRAALGAAGGAAANAMGPTTWGSFFEKINPFGTAVSNVGPSGMSLAQEAAAGLRPI